MKNPFFLDSCDQINSRPLRPWSCPDDRDLYVDVDGTGLAYADFCSRANAKGLLLSGSFTLAVGPNGCGKSSLLHRCAAKIDDLVTADEDYKQCSIVDLSDETNPSIPVREKAQFAWGLIVQDLMEIDGMLTADDSKKLEDKGGEVSQGIRLLTKMLSKRDQILVIILPSLELNKEVAEYLHLLKPNIVLLAESNNSLMSSYCSQHHGARSAKSVNVVELGELNKGDGKLFVRSRLSAYSEQDVDIPDAVIDEFMDKRIGGVSKTSIKELQIVCSSVFARAKENSVNIVSYEDFATHYVINGAL